MDRGELVVLPTDTVYGLGADAFDAEAVSRLHQAKGRGRHMPSPVLVASAEAAQRLVAGLPEQAVALMDAFWPGALTLVANHQASLTGDLGDTHGTVAVRMPAQALALELLALTGSLTGEVPVLRRAGAVSAGQLRAFLPDLEEERPASWSCR